MKLRKAIIPAAGLGTRVLPASKAVPKEMLNLVDKPAIQYIVEEACAAGIEEILIITNRGKEAMENHFDYAPELEERLLEAGKSELLAQTQQTAKLANIYFLRQKETKGLGHAIQCARGFIGDEPFAVLYGDDVIISETPAIGQLADVYNRYGKGVVGVKEVSDADVRKYSSMKVEPAEGRAMYCTDMVEKPQTEAEKFSNYSILGRCVLPPEIFDLLAETKPGAGGEIQLTDAMKELARTQGMMAVDFEGTRYDIGNKLGILKANIEIGLAHPEIGADLETYLKELLRAR